MTAAIVSGAGSGLGFEIARRLMTRGWTVFGLDVDEMGLRSGAEDLGDRFTGIRCDVTDESEVEEAFGRIDETGSAVTGLVNAAGIGGEPGDVTRTTPAQWRRTIDVNLTGAFLISRSAVPLLKAAGGGAVVHISSQLGLVGAKGSPAYSASKGGLIALGRSMALDHAVDGIRVNTVCPGPMDTPMFRASSGPQNLEYLTEERIPLGRIGHPAEVAALVEFLLGDEAGFLTGAAIPIDGGWTAR
jgi:NAD(P)-dependent dehydrogenase (short-subunit alcohol dehydrogenase family)